MALSMDEQRMLDEIERRLASEDPVLAARLTAFGPPGLGIALRSRRGRMLASLIALVTLAVISVAAYIIMPLSPHHTARPAPASSQPATTARAGGNSQPSAPALPPNGTQRRAAARGVSSPAAQAPH